MPIRFKLKKEQIKELGIIRDLGAELIQAIIDKLSSLDPPPIQPYDLHHAISDVLPDRPDEANIIMKQLMSLYNFRRQSNLTQQDILEGILYGITTGEEKWTDEQINRWKEIEPQLLILLSLPTVWTVIKTLDISSDYTNFLRNIKILTDIRPVFSEDASDIQGAVVSYTLRLYYDSLQGSNSLSVAVDKDDIKKLLEICKRALKKGDSAKTFMQEHGVKTHICGEEEERRSE